VVVSDRSVLLSGLPPLGGWRRSAEHARHAPHERALAAPGVRGQPYHDGIARQGPWPSGQPRLTRLTGTRPAGALGRDGPGIAEEGLLAPQREGGGESGSHGDQVAGAKRSSSFCGCSSSVPLLLQDRRSPSAPPSLVRSSSGAQSFQGHEWTLQPRGTSKTSEAGSVHRSS